MSPSSPRVLTTDDDADDSIIKVDHVMLYIAILAVFVMVLEACLHHLQQLVKKRSKYAEMLHKTTSELMIVGLIYMIVKATIFLGLGKYGDDTYRAMDAADVFIFCMAIALVLQSLVIFARLRTSNKFMDDISIMSAKDLLVHAEKTIRESKDTLLTGVIVRHGVRDALRLRVLGQFFNSVFDLPTLFSFPKYIRQVQNSHIAHLLHVNVTVWVVLIGVYTSFFVATGDLQSTSMPTTSPSSFSRGTYQARDTRRYKYFILFVLVLMLTKSLLLLYLRFMVTRLVQHAHTFLSRTVQGHTVPTPQTPITDSATTRGLCRAMQTVADVECQVPRLTTVEAIDQMRHTCEHLMMATNMSSQPNSHHGPRHHCRRGCVDTWRRKWSCLYQHIGAIILPCPQNRGSHDVMTNGTHYLAQQHTLSMKLTDSGLDLPRFSRRTVHFVVQLLLILNGFFYSLLLNAVLHVHKNDDNDDDASRHATQRWISCVSMFVPLLFNSVVLAPKIIRAYAWIDATWHVDGKKLARVIEHFADVEAMKEQMIREIKTYLNAHDHTVEDIRAALVAADTDATDSDQGDGYIDIHALRAVLKKFGLTFTFGCHKFHTFVRLEFKTKGSNIRYNDLLRLLNEEPSHHPQRQR
jgi:hypothetical protein